MVRWGGLWGPCLLARMLASRRPTAVAEDCGSHLQGHRQILWELSKLQVPRRPLRPIRVWGEGGGTSNLAITVLLRIPIKPTKTGPSAFLLWRTGPGCESVHGHIQVQPPPRPARLTFLFPPPGTWVMLSRDPIFDWTLSLKSSFSDLTSTWPPPETRHMGHGSLKEGRARDAGKTPASPRG